MNQDFTEEKALFGCKKILAVAFPLKKNRAQVVSKKKIFVQPENSPPPHHFSNGPFLTIKATTLTHSIYGSSIRSKLG